MEALITEIGRQMPVVGVLLLVFWQLRQDVNHHMEYLERLIERLLEDDD